MRPHTHCFPLDSQAHIRDISVHLPHKTTTSVVSARLQPSAITAQSLAPSTRLNRAPCALPLLQSLPQPSQRIDYGSYPRPATFPPFSYGAPCVLVRPPPLPAYVHHTGLRTSIVCAASSTISTVPTIDPAISRPRPPPLHALVPCTRPAPPAPLSSPCVTLTNTP